MNSCAFCLTNIHREQRPFATEGDGSTVWVDVNGTRHCDSALSDAMPYHVPARQYVQVAA